MARARKHQTDHPAIAWLVIAVVSLLLTLVSEALGVFAGANEGLRGLYGNLALQKGLGVFDPLGLFLTLAVCGGGAGMILGTTARWQAFVLGVSSLILVLMLSPVFAVWGIFWKPFPLVLGLIWAWGCSFFYRVRHRPRAPRSVHHPEGWNVIPLHVDEDDAAGEPAEDGVDDLEKSRRV